MTETWPINRHNRLYSVCGFRTLRMTRCRHVHSNRSYWCPCYSTYFLQPNQVVKQVSSNFIYDRYPQSSAFFLSSSLAISFFEQRELGNNLLRISTKGRLQNLANLATHYLDQMRLEAEA